MEAVSRWRPTLIHSATEFGVGLGGLAAARKSRIPFVSSYHTHFTAYLRHYRLTALNAISWPFLRWFHNSGRITWTPGAIVAEELRTHGFRNVRVWSRGVDPERFSPEFRSREWRARVGATDDTLVVAYVGRLAPEKGIDVALDGMRQVLARHGDRVRFVLVGDGPAEARCRVSAPPGATFLGRLGGRALSEAYASADVFVFPSITETFGNVVLEAMASGLAVIAPDRGATTELATPETALQFPAHDASALAAAVERLLHERDVRARLSAAALAVARTRSWDAVFDQLVRDYRDAIAQP